MIQLKPDGRYCMYLRKSRMDREAELRGEGETLSRHKHILSECAEKFGVKISHIYSELVSGDTIADRPEMQKLISDVEQGMWDGVFVVEVERLARGNTRDQGVVADTFKYSDTYIITPFKIYDPNDESDEEYFEFGLFMSRREYKTITRRLVRGRIAATKEGKFVVGVAPYGYRKVKIPRDKGYTLEIVPEEADIVRQIYDWYCYGECLADGSMKRLGLQAIVNRLNKMGVKPVYKDHWTRSTIADMLKNPEYAGYVTFGRKICRKVPSSNGTTKMKYSSPPDYTFAKGLHEPIISEETYQRCKEIRALNRKSTTPKPEGLQNPLSGLVYCKKCGALMTRINSRTKPILYCPNRNCPTVSSSIELVEKQVLSFLRSWMESYDLTSEEAPIDNEINSLHKLAAKQENDLSSTQRQLDKTYDLFEQGIYELEEFKARRTTLQNKMDTISSSIQNTKADIIDLQRVKKERESFVPTIASLLDMYDTNTNEENNEILRSLLSKIYYTKDVRCKKGEADIASFSLEFFPKLPK